MRRCAALDCPTGDGCDAVHQPEGAMTMLSWQQHRPAKRPIGFLTDEARWEAVRRRDRAADGAFYYSVRTTGVYCRPSCAARLARRENVEFPPRPARRRSAPAFGRASAAGRTKPDLRSGTPRLVANACALIEEADEMPSLDALARGGGLEPLPLPPRVQGGHRRDARRPMRMRVAASACARNSRAARP